MVFVSVLFVILDVMFLLCKYVKMEEFVDVIFEVIKNVFFVFCASEIVSRDDLLWGKMWGKVSVIDLELMFDVLGFFKEMEEFLF